MTCPTRPHGVRVFLRANIPLALSACLLSLSAAYADPPKDRALLAGPVPTAVTGSATAGRCDVNGDGFDDALTADNQRPTNTSYVVFGTPQPLGSSI